MLGLVDFAGFPPSTVHHVRKTGDEDVVYPMGGENRRVETADFPRLGRRLIRRGAMVAVTDLSDVRPFDPSGVRSGG